MPKATTPQVPRDNEGDRGRTDFTKLDAKVAAGAHKQTMTTSNTSSPQNERF